MTSSQRLDAIIKSAEYAIKHGNNLRIKHGIEFTIPTLFINHADKHDIACLVHSRTNYTIRYKTRTKYSMTFRIMY